MKEKIKNTKEKINIKEFIQGDSGSLIKEIYDVLSNLEDRIIKLENK